MTRVPGKKALVRRVRNYRAARNKSEGSFNCMLKFLESHEDCAATAVMPGFPHSARLKSLGWKQLDFEEIIAQAVLSV